MGALANNPAGSDLANLNAARDLAGLALNGWEFDKAMAAHRIRDLAPDVLDSAIERARHWLIPLKKIEPGGIVRDEGEHSGFVFTGASLKLAEALRPLGIKVSPSMAPAQAGAWLAAVVAALSDLPPRVAIRAAQDAIHVPLKAPWDIETAIREKAIEVQARYTNALSRLERLRADIAAQAKAAPMLERQPPPPITQEAVDAMSPEMVRMGLTSGVLIEGADGNVTPAPPDHQRSATDGQPFFCIAARCDKGWDEYLACPGPNCRIEARDVAQARRAA